jgi:phosphohistidine phosphatase SixA
MRKIEIRRHALKGTGSQKEMLSSEGIAQAEKVGAEQMRGKGYTHVATTPYFRTAQTAGAFAKGAGDFAAMHHVTLDALFTKRLDELVAYVKEHGSIVKPEHQLIREEANRMAGEFKEWIDSLPADACVLVVGHSPLIETLIYGYTDQVLAPLKECEGVQLEVDCSEVKLVAELRG